MTSTFSITLIVIASLLGVCVAKDAVPKDAANSTGGWLSGSSTFYGSPTASGPPDNGNKMLRFCFHTHCKKQRMCFFNDLVIQMISIGINN